MNTQPVGRLVEKRQAGVIVMNDASKSGNDAAKKIAQFAAGNQNIVDVQQDLQAVALLGKLVLIGLGGFEVQSVVHSDSDLSSDAFHELNVGIGDGFCQQTAKAYNAPPKLCGAQRQNREGANA